jgi:hypothetical protein
MVPGTCPSTDISRFEPSSAGAAGNVSCSTDADCEGAGVFAAHCLAGLCGPDACLWDKDCPDGQACGCASQFNGNAIHTNRCIPTGCRSNKDCGEKGVCSASVSSAACGGFDGYYCHTPDDRCNTAVDCCTSLPICAYQPALGYWACQAGPVCSG